MPINIELLLSPISEEEPCGPDLTDELVFMGLTVLLTDDDYGSGDSEEPDWSEIRKRSLSILEESKDLKAAMYLTLALLHEDGFPGFRDGLTILHGFIEKFWDRVHPLLDPEDNNDPFVRASIMSNLALPVAKRGDKFRFIQRLREIPLADSPGFGKFDLRDMLIAHDEIKLVEVSEEKPPDVNIIGAAIKNTPEEELETKIQAIGDSLVLLKKIEDAFAEKAGAGNRVDLANTTDIFEKMLQYTRIEDEDPGGRPNPGPDGRPNPGPDGRPQRSERLAGEIQSLDDVRKALDKIVTYYEKNEPSSPVPLFIHRTKKLVGKNFREIIADVASGATNDINSLFGAPEDKT